MSKRNRRADGSLRPAVRRHRAKRYRERLAAMSTEERVEYERKRAEGQAERQGWWDENFDPGARERFFKLSLANYGKAVWLRGFAQSLGLEQEEAAPLLERTANERGWMKLRTKTGMVVGIAPPRNRPERAQVAA